MRGLHQHLPHRCHHRPYVVDGRRCISYLTIENDGPIPEEFRPLMGNRIYGCDDCQLICPWNRYADASPEPDFSPRPNLHRPPLLDLVGLERGRISQAHGRQPHPPHRLSALAPQPGGGPWQRTGQQRGPGRPATGAAEAAPMVAEHIEWALATLARRQQEENKRRDC